jgi:hypothetical protein
LCIASTSRRRLGVSAGGVLAIKRGDARRRDVHRKKCTPHHRTFHTSLRPVWGASAQARARARCALEGGEGAVRGRWQWMRYVYTIRRVKQGTGRARDGSRLRLDRTLSPDRPPGRGAHLVADASSPPRASTPRPTSPQTWATGRGPTRWWWFVRASLRPSCGRVAVERYDAVRCGTDSGNVSWGGSGSVAMATMGA